MSDREEAGAASTSQNEEANFVDNELRYMQRILGQLQLREKKLPRGSQRQVADFKKAWQNFFSSASEHLPLVEPGTQPQPARDHVDAAQAAGRRSGAIPKTIKRARVRTSLQTNIVSTSGSDSADDAQISSSSEITFPNPRRDRNANPVVTTAGRVTTAIGTQSPVATEVETRKTPPLESFNGKNLAKYLGRFEDYCSNKYRGNRNAWLGELERHLSGRTLRAFQSLCDDDDSYDEVCRKLLGWHDDMSEIRIEKSKIEFKRAKIQPDESLYLFSGRLVKLFRLAYPNRQVNLSKTLRDKYVRAVPRHFREILENQVMTEALRGKVMSWSSIQMCARKQDLRFEVNRDSSSNSSDEPNVCVTSSRKMKDATTQHSPAPPPPSSQAVIGPPTTHTQHIEPGNYASHDVQNPWYAGMRRQNPVVGSNLCNHCGRMGHIARDCRSRNRLCFACGSNQHYFRQCPVARQRDSAQLSVPRSSSQPAVPRTHNNQYNTRQFSSSHEQLAGNNGNSVPNRFPNVTNDSVYQPQQSQINNKPQPLN